MRSLLHRLGHRLRRALCVLVAAAMALAPVLSTAAASHEATHAAQGEEHFHAAEHGEQHAQVEAHEHEDTDGMSDAKDLLHGLTHAVHACGHALAILTGNPVVQGEVFSTPLLPVIDLARGSTPPAHPFRPPIA
jgi:hypothetical protein